MNWREYLLPGGKGRQGEMPAAAFSMGDAAGLRELRKWRRDGGDLSSALPNGKTLLVQAIETKQKKIACWMLTQNVNIGGREDSYGPLAAAVKSGDWMFLDRMLAAGASFSNEADMTELLRASENEEEMKSWLLMLSGSFGKAFITKEVSSGGSAIGLCADRGFSACLPFILSLSARRDAHMEELVSFARKRGGLDMLRITALAEKEVLGFEAGVHDTQDERATAKRL